MRFTSVPSKGQLRERVLTPSTFTAGRISTRRSSCAFS